MAWTTVALVRQVSGLTTSDVSDLNLVNYISSAQSAVRSDINTRIYKERVTGSIDSSNKTFLLNFKPIADRDYDLTISIADVAVWTMKVDSTTGEEVYTSVAVTSINALGGAIVLTTAPDPALVDYVVVDYDFTVPNIDYDVLQQATAFMTAHLVMLNLEGTQPSDTYSYRLGKRQITKKGVDLSRTDNVDKFFWKYKELISKIRANTVYVHNKPPLPDITDLTSN